MTKAKLGPSTIMFPYPTVLVGAMVNGKPNFMTASWVGIACSNPPAISVAIRPERHTYKGVVENQTFSINVPGSKLVKATDFCGIYSGRDNNKIDLFNIFYGKIDTAPLIEECPLNLECKVIHTVEVGSHTVFIGEIMETHVNEDCLTKGKPDINKIDPIIYATGTRQYHKIGDKIGRAFKIGDKKNLKDKQ
ncbi:flavin reductase family protein [Candidatus Neomarinimicrobiota bacterium]